MIDYIFRYIVWYLRVVFLDYKSYGRIKNARLFLVILYVHTSMMCSFVLHAHSQTSVCDIILSWQYEQTINVG